MTALVFGLVVLFVVALGLVSLVMALTTWAILHRATDDDDGRRPAFVCPVCGRRSWHPDDGANGYCSACHAFTGAGST